LCRLVSLRLRSADKANQGPYSWIYTYTHVADDNLKHNFWHNILKHNYAVFALKRYTLFSLCLITFGNIGSCMYVLQILSRNTMYVIDVIEKVLFNYNFILIIKIIKSKRKSLFFIIKLI